MKTHQKDDINILYVVSMSVHHLAQTPSAHTQTYVCWTSVVIIWCCRFSLSSTGHTKLTRWFPTGPDDGSSGCCENTDVQTGVHLPCTPHPPAHCSSGGKWSRVPHICIWNFSFSSDSHFVSHLLLKPEEKPKVPFYKMRWTQGKGNTWKVFDEWTGETRTDANNAKNTAQDLMWGDRVVVVVFLCCSNVHGRRMNINKPIKWWLIGRSETWWEFQNKSMSKKWKHNKS